LSTRPLYGSQCTDVPKPECSCCDKCGRHGRSNYQTVCRQGQSAPLRACPPKVSVARTSNPEESLAAAERDRGNWRRSFARARGVVECGLSGSAEIPQERNRVAAEIIIPDGTSLHVGKQDYHQKCATAFVVCLCLSASGAPSGRATQPISPQTG